MRQPRNRDFIYEKVCAALMTEPTIQAAAAKASVSASTIAKWMRSNPDFQKIFSAARSRTLDLAMLRGLRKCENMVDVLVDVATGEPKSNCVAKVTAASTLLDFMLRIAKLEQIQESIARLEQDRANGYVVAPPEAPFESPALPTTAKDESEPIQ